MVWIFRHLVFLGLVGSNLFKLVQIRSNKSDVFLDKNALFLNLLYYDVGSEWLSTSTIPRPTIIHQVPFFLISQNMRLRQGTTDKLLFISADTDMHR